MTTTTTTAGRTIGSGRYVQSSRTDNNMPHQTNHPADGICQQQPTKIVQHRPLHRATYAYPHSIGFLIEGHYEPDLVSLLLRRAGDVEVNPGPVQTRRQTRLDSQRGKQAEGINMHDSATKLATHDAPTQTTPTSTMPAPNVQLTPNKPTHAMVESDLPQAISPTPTAVDISPTTNKTPESSRRIVRTPVAAQRTSERMPRRKPTRKTKKKAEMPIETCKKCKDKFNSNSVEIECAMCKGSFHKIKCGGRPRYQMDKFTGKNEKSKKEKKKKKQETR